jgi:UDP-N-acetyl-2-amino-2-deoxyglucuronate dehydrogenase
MKTDDYLIMKDFALIGAAGFIAPRHITAIKQTGNRLVAAVDPHDSVGVLDSYFPDAAFFTQFERFDRHIEKLRRHERAVDYLSVCSPNYLHDAHIRYGLRTGMNVICEKPVVLHPKNIAPLQELEKATGSSVNTILQLRLHPSLLALKKRIEAADPSINHEVDLTYITVRGPWYYCSWKGDLQKSGGVATNIGIHFFDLLLWLFGAVKSSVVHVHQHDRASGFLQLEKARVRWFLSINAATLLREQSEKGLSSYRSLVVDGTPIDFTDMQEDLIGKTYEQILSGKGLGLGETLGSIELAYSIRKSVPVGLKNDYHPLAALPLARHPFEEI